jgi:hypothetical protein
MKVEITERDDSRDNRNRWQEKKQKEMIVEITERDDSKANGKRWK